MKEKLSKIMAKNQKYDSKSFITIIPKFGRYTLKEVY